MITFITPACPRCGKQSKYQITEEEWLAWEKWQNSALKIELVKYLPMSLRTDVFPDWPASSVRQFHSGLHPFCTPPRYGGRYI